MDGLFLALHILEIYLLLRQPAKKGKVREYPQIVKRYPDMGGMVTPIPEVDRELEQRMKAYYCNGGAMKFTEKFIMQTFGATQVQAINIKAKWQRDGILKRENESAVNSPHVLASYGKMRKL